MPSPDKVFYVNISSTSGQVIKSQSIIALKSLNDITSVPANLRSLTLTADRQANNVYDYFYIKGTSTLKITSSNINKHADSRVVFWPKSQTATTDQESCATWESQTPTDGTSVSGAGGNPQEGLALRVTDINGVTRAITITKNIYANAFWEINVHLWNTSSPNTFILLQGFNMSHVLLTQPGNKYVRFPWNICGKVVGNTISFKIWPSTVSEPDWNNSEYVRSVVIPSYYQNEYSGPGFAGWYFGHIGQGGDIVYNNLYSGIPK